LDELSVENLSRATKKNSQHLNDELLIGGQQPPTGVLFSVLNLFPSYLFNPRS